MARFLRLSAVILATSTVVEGRAFMEATDLGEAVSKAMDEVLGCGQQRTNAKHFEEIRRLLLPMWRTMPSRNERLDWRSVRYVAHRFFMKRSSMVVRGFEPSRLVTDGDSGADILSRTVPEHADLLFGGAHSKSGFAFEDVVALLAGLERLVVDSETELLEAVYAQVGMQQTKDLTLRQIRKLLEVYMINWMLGEDKASISVLLKNHTLLENSFPHWQALKGFVHGRVRTLDFGRTLAPKGHGHSLMNGRYSFTDVHEVVGGITQSFQVFWQSECAGMKAQLVSMDKEGSGRVSLADFYGSAMSNEIRFAESESYLRELGVLDKTAPWKGKQVIIANYLQAANNCIVSSKNYLVCCSNECEQLLGDIEEHVGAPFGTPEQVLDIVANMSSPSSVDDEPPEITEALREQLNRMAESHGGKVPLHGRLFAQFLHYTFPRECAFPHKAGAFASHTLNPQSFDGYRTSVDEMTRHTNSSQDIAEAPADAAELQMWSEDEELFADYGGKGDMNALIIKVCFLVLALVSAVMLKVLSMMETQSKKARARKGILDVAPPLQPSRPLNSHLV
jgi:hypothetical protein